MSSSPAATAPLGPTAFLSHLPIRDSLIPVTLIRAGLACALATPLSLPTDDLLEGPLHPFADQTRPRDSR